jgi:N-acetylglutamate synthase-like GNAT family acetyltransferase
MTPPESRVRACYSARGAAECRINRDGMDLMASSKEKAHICDMQNSARSRTGYRSGTRPPPRGAHAPAPVKTKRAKGETFTTPDGRRLSLRAIAPGDAEALRRGFARLTPEQARLRTFHRIAELSPEMTERLTNVDPATTTALVVVDADGEIRGDARLHVDATTDSAEFGIAVDPDYTNQGIGWRLMQRLFEDAKRRGLYELWGDVLAENHTMLDFAKAVGAERHPLENEPGVIRVTFRIA